MPDEAVGGPAVTGAEYIAFLGASVILAVTPGPDTFLTLRFAAHSVRGGLVYTLAAAAGVLVWAVLALTGVAALLERFPEIRVALTWVGGGYLVLLGVTALLQVRRAVRERASHAAAAPASQATAVPEVPVPVGDGAQVGSGAGSGSGLGSGTAAVAVAAPAEPEAPIVPRLPARRLPRVFRTGLISSLTNPKTGLFFLALLPPFLPASPGPVEHVLLVATVVGCMLVYGAGLSVIAGRAGRFLTGGAGPLIVDGVAGGILVVLGVSLVVL